MENDVVTLVKEIDELGTYILKRDELEPLLEITEEQYLDAHLTVPQKKETKFTIAPSKNRIIKTGSFFAAFLVTFIVGLIMVISCVSTRNNIVDLRSKPGKEYTEWLESFGDVDTFDDLEDGWKDVQKSWAKQGIKVDWVYVEEVKSGIRNSTIYADVFSSKIFEAMMEDSMKGYNGKVTFMALSCIAMIISAFMTVSRCREYKREMLEHQRIEHKNYQARRFNEQEWPKLMAECEKKKLELIEDYKESIKSVKVVLADAYEEIDKRAHLLPVYYHPYANSIASILLRGRAETLKEAINIFEEDKRAEEMADIERQRAADEARHREAMEREARRAADLAHEDALAQQRLMRDQMAADQRAREAAKRQADAQAAADRNARSAAMQRCHKCANYSACGSARGNPNCGSFRPK